MIFKCILLLFITVFIDAQFTYYHQPSPCAVPRISHGRVRTMRRGNLIRYSCLARYTLVGNKYATCRGGHWDVPIPTCVKSGCSPLGDVQNAVAMSSHNDSWVVFFCLPGHQLVGSQVVYCDGRQWNSSVPACVDSKAKPATECDFEDENICGWKLTDLHDFDWRRWNKKTPSSFLQTGPTYDHTYGKNGTGFYMYIESTGRVENETARLISPVYDNDVTTDGCFVFFYHMFGRSMGGLRVYQKPEKVSLYEVLKGEGKERYLLFEKWGDQGNEWYSSVSMLSNFSDAFQIVIEGIRGASFMSDIAIDDVSIQHGDNCTKAMVAATTPPSLLESGCSPLGDVQNAVAMSSHNDSWVVFFCLPGHQLVGSQVVYCDGRQWNSSAPACVDSKAKPATECDFEDENICGWKLDDLHDFDWRRWNKKTPSSFLQTGPTYDHTYGKNGTGFYMYIESIGRVENETARLISPVYDNDVTTDGCFVFFYHMFGRSMGGLRVYQKPEKVSLYEVLKGEGKERYLLFEKWGDQGNEWYSSVSMLSNFSDAFQIVIEGIRGASFMSDIAIDDVSIQHGDNCTKAMVAATTPPSLLESGCSPLGDVQNAVAMSSHNDSWVVFFCLPGHQLVGSQVVYCDGRQWNSSAPACVDSKAKPATECDFEDENICGWKLDDLHDFDWRRWNKKTPSSFLQTGPTYDHTYGKNGTGFYMYIESIGRVENETARLISPVYDNDVTTDGCFVFFYHMFGRSMGGLRVYQKPEKVSLYEVLKGEGKERYLLFEKWGDQGNEWYSSVSMLSNFSDAFQIVIEGIRGASFMSDIAIDDVSIQHGDNCTKAMVAATTPPSLLESGCSPLGDVQNAVAMSSHNDSWVVFFCLPGHQLVGSQVVYCDGRQWNSSAPACVDSKAKPATECDFEDENICGWKLDDLHDFDWRRWNKKTPSSFLQTGPTYDHTYGKNGTGFYMYIESIGRVENETARLISPVYDNDVTTDGCFVFFYHMFGRMGGLRVYQKPEKVSLYEVLKGEGKERYLLFEKWGDQGNEWYSSVSMLSNFSDAFQIVIEGIRGASFMSDIAIDDVSIQHGDNCTKAMVAATTPPSLLESCVGRCDMYGFDHELPQRGCGCDITCVVDENCCPDFLDVCAFNISNNDEDTTPVASSDSLPQTKKLVATTTDTLPPTTSTTTSTTPSTTSTTTTSSTSTTTTTTTRISSITPEKCLPLVIY